MTILALSGKAGSGKDTMAAVLVNKYGFTRVSLADPLRQLCADTFRIPYEYFLDYDKKDARLPDGKLILDYHHIDKVRFQLEEWGFPISYEARENMEEYYGAEFETPRDILRLIGTNLVRNFAGADIWIILAFSKMSKQAGQKFVITDCRFENERKCFKGAGATLCLIKRWEVDPEAMAVGEDTGSDDEYDVIFDNKETLNVFNSQVEMWYKTMETELGFYRKYKYEY
jgi:hypothetical protein